MAKNIRTSYQLLNTDVADKLILVLAAQDASVAEIAEALDNTSTDIEDGIEYPLGQNKVRRVWDFRLPPSNTISTYGTAETFNWKLPPKGIPVLKGRGLAIFGYNWDGAQDFVNGPVLHSITKTMGGWF